MTPVLQKLYLHDFRSHSQTRINFTAPVSVLTGANGRGKTNVLEAVNFLSVLRSWRTTGVRDLIKLGTPGFELQCRVGASSAERVLCVRQTAETRMLSIGGEPVRKSSEFIREFRTVVFAPEDKTIVAGSAQFRRRWIDGALSMQSPAYLVSLQNYTKALAERNAALKKPASKAADMVLEAFDRSLIDSGIAAMTARRDFAARIAQEVNELIGSPRFNLEYLPNAPEAPEAYAETLCRSLAHDRRYGFTACGLQGDDLKMTLDGKMLRSFGSSGQLRKIALLLKLAELKLAKRQQLPVVALIDDVCGELDADNRAHFFELCSGCDQLLMTFTEMPRDQFFRSAAEIPI